jgi:hypothetical protein
LSKLWSGYVWGGYVWGGGFLAAVNFLPPLNLMTGGRKAAAP